MDQLAGLRNGQSPRGYGFTFMRTRIQDFCCSASGRWPHAGSYGPPEACVLCGPARDTGRLYADERELGILKEHAQRPLRRS
jgi:hypothetical protein